MVAHCCGLTGVYNVQGSQRDRVFPLDCVDAKSNGRSWTAKSTAPPVGDCLQVSISCMRETSALISNAGDVRDTQSSRHSYCGSDARGRTFCSWCLAVLTEPGNIVNKTQTLTFN
jgi:hypothetical protein